MKEEEEETVGVGKDPEGWISEERWCTSGSKLKRAEIQSKERVS